MSVSRRTLLKTSAIAMGHWLAPLPAFATREDANAAIIATFGDRPLQEGRVSVQIPAISENGYSVPMTVEVDSPMTEADHVVRISIFAEENPIPNVAHFELRPETGIARVQTRIRLAASQRVRAVAEMSDGSLWTSYTFSIVTLAACVL